MTTTKINPYMAGIREAIEECGGKSSITIESLRNRP